MREEPQAILFNGLKFVIVFCFLLCFFFREFYDLHPILNLSEYEKYGLNTCWNLKKKYDQGVQSEFQHKAMLILFFMNKRYPRKTFGV